MSYELKLICKSNTRAARSARFATAYHPLKGTPNPRSSWMSQHSNA
jgi:hypothetical protein